MTDAIADGDGVPGGPLEVQAQGETSTEPSSLSHEYEASFKDMANAIRALSMDAVQKANSGHPGMPMGMADVATVLFSRFLKFNAADPDWPNRDRFVLSAGHGSMLLYALLYLTGTGDLDIEDIKNFRQLGAPTAGHPEYGASAGIETTTGPLGQGFAAAVGMALGERLTSAHHSAEICDHFTYVIVGDGCLMEGISHEALSLAGHLKLGKLIVLFDDNQISIDGATDLSVSDDQKQRFQASNWHVAEVDGHDPEAISLALENARNVTDQPSMIACRTVIGFGAPTKQGTASTHGAPLGKEEIAGTRKTLGWPYAPFEIPQSILASWRQAGSRSRPAYDAWTKAAKKLDPRSLSRLREPIDSELEAEIHAAIAKTKKKFVDEKPKLATRVSSCRVLEELVPLIPGLIGGSADLTGSNGTITSHHKAVNPDDFSGTYMHYGVREHAMASAMNGLSLYGGFVPYSGTFLVFSDYCRPSIRLSALMKQRVIYVMTHDSIGLGEDGPTHQPVEHLAALRAMPNLYVMRPADAVECAECWEIALMAKETPTILVLTRQGLPTFRAGGEGDENRAAHGAYVARKPEGSRDVTLLATGSEVSLALEAGETLAAEGLKAAVISMPCWELFERQSESYRQSVLGTAPLIGVEAAASLGWAKWLGRDGLFVGMSSFGGSAPAGDLYRHFEITSAHVAEKARALIKTAK